MSVIRTPPRCWSGPGSGLGRWLASDGTPIVAAVGIRVVELLIHQRLDPHPRGTFDHRDDNMQLRGTTRD
jgi:hypothetical protein